MIVADLVQLLLASPAVTALAGNRVYGGYVPQAVQVTDPSKRYPYVLVRRQGAAHTHSYKGRAGQCASRLEIDCYGHLYSESEQLADVVGRFLDGYQGPAPGNVTSLQGLFISDEQDEISPPIHADEAGALASTIQLTAWHSE